MFQRGGDDVVSKPFSYLEQQTGQFQVVFGQESLRTGREVNATALIDFRCGTIDLLAARLATTSGAAMVKAPGDHHRTLSCLLCVAAGLTGVSGTAASTAEPPLPAAPP